MSDYIVQDVCEVIITDVVSGKVAFLGNTKASGITQQINEEKIRAGIGNGVIFLLRSDKEIDINVTSATFNKETLAMTQGVAVDPNGKLAVTKNKYLTVVEGDNSELQVTIPDAPTGLVEAILEDLDESQESVAVTTGVITIPTGAVAKKGDKVQVFYKEEIKGNVIDFDAAKFSSKYKVELRTIAYDLDTAKVISNIYFVFPETIPSGEFSLDFSAGEVINPEIKFSAVTPKGESSMGKFIEELV